MCGIGGFFALQTRPADPAALLFRMTESMRNRGPDGHGSWVSEGAQVGFAHRRLAILDPTANSDQPMHSADGRLTIVFNGEIYNFRSLRSDLQHQGHVFRTTGDTEVLLHLYERYGDEMMHRLRGMYAFAIWDKVQRRMLLARDPLGIKPMYYSTVGGMLRFSSQVKTLEPLLERKTPDPAGRAGFLLWGSVPEPYTSYREIRAVPAGYRMVLEPDAEPKLIPGETVAQILADAARGPAPLPTDRKSLLHDALTDTVKAHMVSDVPVALFLSAGRDSTMLAALAAELPDVHLKALTLSFDEVAGTVQDEAPLARSVAAHYGIPFFEEVVGCESFAADYDTMLAAMDQPTIDGVNVYFVSRMAKRAGYKVALSGLGGDELFAGYPSFQQIPRMTRLFGWAKNTPALGRGFRLVSAAAMRRWTSPKYAGMLEYGHSIAGAYLLRRGLYMPWELPGVMDPDMAAEGLRELQQVQRMQQEMGPLAELPHADRLRISVLEMTMYMRNQLLRDADWAGMANSVEVRVPLVDTGLLKQIAPLLVHGAAPTKEDMAMAPARRLPEAILNRPKTGFAVPVREWLLSGQSAPQPERGLRGWARHLESAFA